MKIRDLYPKLLMIKCYSYPLIKMNLYIMKCQKMYILVLSGEGCMVAPMAPGLIAFDETVTGDVEVGVVSDNLIDAID